MDSIALLHRVVGETDRLVRGTTPADLSARTPCSEWTVRDLLNHVVGGSTMFAVSAETGSVPDDVLAQIGGDNLGDDYQGAWSAASQRALDAFDLPGVMDKQVTLPFGAMPAAVALNIAVVDVATHATDLAIATGQTFDDEEALEAALAIGKQMIGPEMRKPGFFSAEQTVPDDAPVVTRLQAFAGRTA